ncbi:hypothetical protein BpHYR1_050168 [Brachionus plicatilis]|uniref:Uncharacterized protein n=1 Tax=Brachionus plicatilis TaxID=10195 RepID=A0A3M7PHQ9_BRAPC|nr:hypothetical protein BpHYR1_050168 [Brachionus plicatilis]
MRHLPDWSAFLTTTNDQNNPPNFFFKYTCFIYFLNPYLMLCFCHHKYLKISILGPLVTHNLKKIKNI